MSEGRRMVTVFAAASRRIVADLEAAPPPPEAAAQEDLPGPLAAWLEERRRQVAAGSVLFGGDRGRELVEEVIATQVELVRTLGHHPVGQRGIAQLGFVLGTIDAVMRLEKLLMTGGAVRGAAAKGGETLAARRKSRTAVRNERLALAYLARRPASKKSATALMAEVGAEGGLGRSAAIVAVKAGLAGLQKKSSGEPATADDLSTM